MTLIELLYAYDQATTDIQRTHFEKTNNDVIVEIEGTVFNVYETYISVETQHWGHFFADYQPSFSDKAFSLAKGTKIKFKGRLTKLETVIGRPSVHTSLIENTFQVL